MIQAGKLQEPVGEGYMSAMISAYENRLRVGAEQLEELERSGRTDRRYDRLLRQWQQLLAAYEFECEVAETGSSLLAAI